MDLADAGLLDNLILKGWPPRPEVLPQVELRQPEFVASAMTVHQGGQVRKVRIA